MSKEELTRLITTDPKEFESRKGEIQDLSEIEIVAQEIKDVDLSNIDFSGASFAESSLVNVNFAECDLTGVDFSRATLEECDFSECILNNADFSYSTVTYCNFNEADVAGCTFNEADLTSSDLSTCENLSACRFDDGTIWPDNDKLPEDFDSSYSYDLSSLQDEEDQEEGNYEY